MGSVESLRDSWNLDGPRPSLEEARAEVERILLNHERNRAGTFVHLCLAITDRNSGRYIGWCGLDHRDASRPAPVIFFLLKKAYRGNGLATEAAAAILRYGLVDLGLQRVDGACAPDNPASGRVMEKIGMRYVGQDTEGGLEYSATRRDLGPTSDAAR
jgi:[ribosomal protein S5]-alanine N-acetyltransferase